MKRLFSYSDGSSTLEGRYFLTVLSKSAAFVFSEKCLWTGAGYLFSLLIRSGFRSAGS